MKNEKTTQLPQHAGAFQQICFGKMLCIGLAGANFKFHVLIGQAKLFLRSLSIILARKNEEGIFAGTKFMIVNEII